MATASMPAPRRSRTAPWTRGRPDPGPGGRGRRADYLVPQFTGCSGELGVPFVSRVARRGFQAKSGMVVVDGRRVDVVTLGGDNWKPCQLVVPFSSCCVAGGGDSWGPFWAGRMFRQSRPAGRPGTCCQHFRHKFRCVNPARFGWSRTTYKPVHVVVSEIRKAGAIGAFGGCRGAFPAEDIVR